MTHMHHCNLHGHFPATTFPIIFTHEQKQYPPCPVTHHTHLYVHGSHSHSTTNHHLTDYHFPTHILITTSSHHLTPIPTFPSCLYSSTCSSPPIQPPCHLLILVCHIRMFYFMILFFGSYVTTIINEFSPRCLEILVAVVTNRDRCAHL